MSQTFCNCSQDEYAGFFDLPVRVEQRFFENRQQHGQERLVKHVRQHVQSCCRALSCNTTSTAAFWHFTRIGQFCRVGTLQESSCGQINVVTNLNYHSPFFLSFSFKETWTPELPWQNFCFCFELLRQLLKDLFCTDGRLNVAAFWFSFNFNTESIYSLRFQSDKASSSSNSSSESSVSCKTEVGYLCHATNGLLPLISFVCYDESGTTHWQIFFYAATEMPKSPTKIRNRMTISNRGEMFLMLYYLLE